MSAIQRRGTFDSPQNDGPRIELTADEKRLYAQLFRQCDPEGLGVVTGDVARTLFERTGLSQATLGEIWQTADTENAGFLTQVGFSQALRLIGHVQSGQAVNRSLVDTPGPLPVFDGKPREVGTVSSPAGMAPQSTGGTGGAAPIGQVRIPPLMPQNRQKYIQLFERSAPNGYLDGDVAKNIFLKAKLPNETLGQIWNLSDVQGKGSLTQTEFVVAMHLIQSVLNRQLPRVPHSLPPTLFDAAAGRQVTRASTYRPSSQNSSRQGSIAMQFTGGSTTAGRMSPAVSTSGIPAQPSEQIEMGVSPQERARFDSIFDTLDKAKTGSIGANEVVPFLTTSKLSEDILAQVWDLADLHNTGQFGKKEFAIAMFLVQQKLAGRDLPQSLPPSVLASVEGKNEIPSVFQPGGGNGTGSEATAPVQQQRNQPVQQPAQALSRPMNDDLMELNDIFSAPSPPVANFTPPAPSSRQFVPTSSFGQNLALQNDGNASPISPSSRQVSTSEIGAPQPQSATGASNARGMLTEGDNLKAMPSVAGVSAGMAAGVVAGTAAGLAAGAPTTGDFGHKNKEITALESQNAQITKERSQAEQELATVLNTKKETEDKLAALRSNYDAEALKIHQTKEALSASRTEVKALENQLSLVEASLGALQTERQKVQSELQVSQEQNAALKEKLKATNEQVDTLKAEIESAQHEAEQQQSHVKSNEDELARAEHERTQLQESLENLRLNEQERAASAGLQAKEIASTSPRSALSSHGLSKETLTEAPVDEEPASRSTRQHMTAAEAVAAAAAGTGVGLDAAAGLGNPFSKFNRSQFDYGGAGGMHVASPPSTAPARSSTLNTDETPGSSPATSEFQGGMYNAPPPLEGDSTAGMPTFTLPIARPGSATSSVQNNPPLSVRGDLDGSRPESPAYSNSDAVGGSLPVMPDDSADPGSFEQRGGPSATFADNDRDVELQSAEPEAAAKSLGQDTGGSASTSVEHISEPLPSDGSNAGLTVGPPTDFDVGGHGNQPEAVSQFGHSHTESQDYESANDSFEFVDAEDTSTLPGAFPSGPEVTGATAITSNSPRDTQRYGQEDESSDDDDGPTSVVPQRPAGYDRHEPQTTGADATGAGTAATTATADTTKLATVGAPTSADNNAFGTTQLSAPVDDDPFASAFSGLSEAKEEDPNVTTGGDFETTDNFDEFDSPFGSFPNPSHNGSVFAQQTVVQPPTQSSPFAVAPTSIPTNNDEWNELFADFPSGPTDPATTASNADINDAFSTQRAPATKPQSPKSSAVADLVGMGFSHADALDALEKKNFNVADATNYLLDK